MLYLAIHHEPSKSANNALYYASLDGRENRALFNCQSNAVYAGGFLLFARGDQLMAQPFDPASGTLSGEPVSLAKGVMNDVTTWHMDASAFGNGLLLVGNGGSGDWQLVWVDRSGKQISIAADKLTNLQTAAISPHGDRIVLQLDTGQSDIWVLDVARGVRTRLTFGPAQMLSQSGHPMGSGSPIPPIATVIPTFTASSPMVAGRRSFCSAMNRSLLPPTGRATAST